MPSTPRKSPGRPPGKASKSSQTNDPEALLSTAVSQNLLLLQSLRVKIHGQTKKLAESLQTHEVETGEVALTKRQEVIASLTNTYKTLSDATANAVKALGALKKLDNKPDDTEKDDEILKKIFGDTNDENGNETT